MVWVSDHKNSEVMALLAVGLVHYTCVITRVGHFTLYSNLLVGRGGGEFPGPEPVGRSFLWQPGGHVRGPMASGVFTTAKPGSGLPPGEGLWSGTYFLIAYWVIFTAAVFLSRAQEFAGELSPRFLAEQGAFFSMFLLTMLQVREGGFGDSRSFTEWCCWASPRRRVGSAARTAGRKFVPDPRLAPGHGGVHFQVGRGCSWP